MRFHLPEKKPLYTLQIQGCDPINLFPHDFEKAKPHQAWLLRAPEESDGDGVILQEVVCMGDGRFAVIRQLRNTDGTEVAAEPEYFYYQHGTLFHPGMLEQQDEPEDARRYPHLQSEMQSGIELRH